MMRNIADTYFRDDKLDALNKTHELYRARDTRLDIAAVCQRKSMNPHSVNPTSWWRSTAHDSVPNGADLP